MQVAVVLGMMTYSPILQVIPATVTVHHADSVHAAAIADLAVEP